MSEGVELGVYEELHIQPRQIYVCPECGREVLDVIAASDGPCPKTTWKICLWCMKRVENPVLWKPDETS